MRDPSNDSMEPAASRTGVFAPAAVDNPDPGREPRNTAPTSPLATRWVGRRILYEARLSTSVRSGEVDTATRAESDGLAPASALGGEQVNVHFAVDVLAHDADTRTFSLDVVLLGSSTSTVPCSEAEYEGLSLHAELTQRGEFRVVGGGATLRDEERTMLTLLGYAALNFPRPADDLCDTTWLVDRLEDGTGVCPAELSLLGEFQGGLVRMRRVKREYLETVGARLAGVEIKLLEGTTEAELEDVLWPQSLHSLEGITFGHPGQSWFYVHTDLYVQRTHVGPMPPPQPSKARPAVEPEESVSPRQVLELMSDLLQLHQNGEGSSDAANQAWLMLMRWLRDSPELVSLAASDVNRLSAQRPLPAGLPAIVSAMVAAGAGGQAQAQAVVAQWVRDESLPRDVRLVAIGASAQLGPHCSPGLLNALVGASMTGDADLRGAAELAVGTRLSYAEDSSSRDLLSRALNEIKDRCIREGRVEDLLRVAVNSEATGLCEVALSQVNAESSSTRLWAARAMRYLPGVEAQEALTRLCLDPNEEVRQAALAALSAR